MTFHSFLLDRLEDRTLFSVVAPAGAVPAAAGSAIHAARHSRTASHPLAGTFNVAGHYTHPIGNPDAGSHYNMNGSGNNQALGNFTLSGDIAAPGFVANGHASGHLTITNSHGTITLRVVGPPQAPGALPPSVTFKITKGTGKYAHSTGGGHIAINASGSTRKFLLRFNPTR